MSMPSGPVVLPFKSERISFGLSYRSEKDDAVAVDLAAICFDRDGKLLDAAHNDRRAALAGALRLVSDPQHEKGLDEALIMQPFDFAPQCEVMLLVLSAPSSPLKRSDLGCAKQLRFMTTAREKGMTDDTKILDVDLTPFVSSPAKQGSGPLSNGNQSMLVCAVYATPSGWTMSFNCSTFAADNWGALLPRLEAMLSSWPFLSAAESVAAKPKEEALAPIVMSRHGMDRSLEDLQVSSSSESVPAAAQLVLELGWTLHPPRKSKAEGEEEDEGGAEEEQEEDPEIEFSLGAYNVKGEELQSVSPESPEGEGLTVADPEEEAEAEAEGQGEEEQQQPPEEEDEPIGEGEAEEDEEARAARKAAEEVKRAELEAEKRAAALRKPYYPEAFPKKHKVTISLQELPKATRSLLLMISNYGGGGLKRVASLQARLTLPGKGGKGTERVLAHCRLNSAEGADEALTQVAMLKLYKELGDGAFAAWSASSALDAQALAAAPGSKDLLKSILDARNQIVSEVVAANAKAEAEGIEEDEEDAVDEEEEEEVIAEAEAAPGGVCARSARVQRQRLKRADWRVRAVCAAAAGEEPDEALVANALNYEGEMTADRMRQDAAAKAMYPNGDTYFGGYAADVKSGVGLYVFGSGASYLGSYVGGKRQGRGMMVMPDTGIYEGQWAEDRFDGQGSYYYPDGSYYTGAWKAGKKHGVGTFWDTTGGCLHGMWEKGSLQGDGRYDQPNYHFEGKFVKSVPAGPCSFQLAAFRSSDLPQAATGYLVADYGPTLRCEGAYSIPPGAGAEPEGEEEVADDGRPQLPSFPKYEGLGFLSAVVLPCSVPEVAFPPAACSLRHG